MRGKRSVPVRLGRMEQQRTTRQREETITILAEEFGLHPGEVRAELQASERHIRQYGPEPPGATLRRTAEEFGLDAAELQAEVEQARVRLRARGVVL